MARKLAAVMFLLGCLQATPALSLGLGSLQLQSFLNEPLEATVDLLDMGGLHEDEVVIRLGSSDDFEKFGLERPYFLSSITFDVIAGENGAASIILSSDEPVLEPYLDFILEARWPSGRLLREYTVLIDPPLFAEVETVAVSAGQRMDEIEGIPASTNKNAEVFTSVTSLETRFTGLAANAMPQRGYNSTTVASPVPGGRYRVSRNDTLWRIASLAKPQDASVQQTMLDIQRLNPDAFVDGNINTVKAGYIIELPSESDMGSLGASAALAEVREQNAAWRDGAQTLLKTASGPSLTISTEVNDDAGDETAEIDDAVARPVVEEVVPELLPVAEAESNDQGSAPSLADEMQERLLVAEQQLETLQRIISLKNDQIAALQSALVAAGAIADVDEEANAEALPENASSEMPLDSDESQKAGSEIDADTSETEVGGLWWNGLLYLLGVVALGVVALVLVRRRQVADDSISRAPSSWSIEEVFAAPRVEDPGLNVEESMRETGSFEDDFGTTERRDDEPSAHAEVVDVLADVEIYLIYERHAKAIDLLNHAIASDPDNPVYRRKLLEVEAQSNDQAAPYSAPDKERQDLARDKEDELSFSADFASPNSAGFDNEDLVIAADGYDLSTKLDLARAYIDMGDDEAARQILEEVVAEGTDDLKAEASALLDRIGG
jgi:pilus assembly protein FimV